MEPNWRSIVPALLAVLLAFVLRDAVISLLLACIVGVLPMGKGLPVFFSDYFRPFFGGAVGRIEGLDTLRHLSSWETEITFHPKRMYGCFVSY